MLLRWQAPHKRQRIESPGECPRLTVWCSGGNCACVRSANIYALAIAISATVTMLSCTYLLANIGQYFGRLIVTYSDHIEPLSTRTTAHTYCPNRRKPSIPGCAAAAVSFGDGGAGSGAAAYCGWSYAAC